MDSVLSTIEAFFGDDAAPTWSGLPGRDRGDAGGSAAGALVSEQRGGEGPGGLWRLGRPRLLCPAIGRGSDCRALPRHPLPVPQGVPEPAVLVLGLRLPAANDEVFGAMIEGPADGKPRMDALAPLLGVCGHWASAEIGASARSGSCRPASANSSPNTRP